MSSAQISCGGKNQKNRSILIKPRVVEKKHPEENSPMLPYGEVQYLLNSLECY